MCSSDLSATGAGPFFTSQNAAATPAGLLGLQTLTGTPFDVQLTEFATAIMLNGTGAPTPTHGFTTYDFPSAVTVVGGGGTYPFPVTGTTPAGFEGSWTGPIGNAGLRIHDFVSNTGKAGEITVQVEEPAQLVIVRVR